MRYILIGSLVILVAAVGLIAWFGYESLKKPMPKAAPPVAVHSKIPPVPKPTKVPQSQKIMAPQPEASPAPAPVPAVTERVSPAGMDQKPGPAEEPETPEMAETAREAQPGQGSAPRADAVQNAPVENEPKAPEPEAVPKQAAPAASTDLTAKAAPATQPAPQPAAAPPAAKESAPEPAQVQPEPTPEPTPEPAAETVPSKPEPFTIQVGAYLTRTYAEDQEADLKKRGYAPFIYETRDKQQRTWYLVRLGHFPDRPAAQAFLSDFKSKENMAAVIAVSQKR